jgi:hypothetical protein
MPCRVHKRIRGIQQEEVALQNLLRLAEFLLRLLKVKVNVQGFDEVRDRVVVLVALLPDNAHEILDLLLVLIRVAASGRLVPACYHGCGEVSQDPGAVGLDGVDVGGREEHIGESFARGLVVEEWEQRPVDQPGAVVELCERVVEESCVDGFLDLVDLLERGLPVDGEDFAGELAPGGRVGLVVVGRLQSVSG